MPVTRTFNLFGVGVGLLPQFSGSNELRVLALPIIRASYRDKLYFNVLQAGVWLWDAEDKSLRIGLAIEPRFGWESKSGSRVDGMEKRDFSFEGGPNVQWRTPVGVVNASLSQDLGGASNGQNAQLQFIRPLLTGQTLRLNGFAGLQWFSSKMNDYYFGVRANEATATRPQYTAGSTTNLQFGVNGSYQVTRRGSVLFGAIINRLGDEATQSPIVETRWQPVVFAGYGITF